MLLTWSPGPLSSSHPPWASVSLAQLPFPALTGGWGRGGLGVDSPSLGGFPKHSAQRGAATQLEQ